MNEYDDKNRTKVTGFQAFKQLIFSHRRYVRELITPASLCLNEHENLKTNEFLFEHLQQQAEANEVTTKSIQGQASCLIKRQTSDVQSHWRVLSRA